MEKIAGKIVQWLIKDSENEERAELYYYGVKEGLHILINILTMVVVGAIVGRLAECVLFYISYSLLRTYAGGYHADTRFRCYVLSTILLVIYLITLDVVLQYKMISLIIVWISAIIILVFAPVQNRNHVLDSKEKKVFRTVALWVLLIYNILLMAALWLKWRVITVCLTETIIWVAVMLILGRLKYGKEERRER